MADRKLGRILQERNAYLNWTEVPLNGIFITSPFKFLLLPIFLSKLRLALYHWYLIISFRKNPSISAPIGHKYRAHFVCNKDSPMSSIQPPAPCLCCHRFHQWTQCKSYWSSSNVFYADNWWKVLIKSLQLTLQAIFWCLRCQRCAVFDNFYACLVWCFLSQWSFHAWIKLSITFFFSGFLLEIFLSLHTNYKINE